MSARELVDRLRAYQPPNTNLGQHFLIDDDLLKRMVHIAEVDDNDHVLEIGPGPWNAYTAAASNRSKGNCNRT